MQEEPNTESRRILVTGGAGFIGSYLCEKYLLEGHHVLCLDNFVTGREENIKVLMEHPEFELLRHDITQPIHIEVDWIFNFACPASPPHYQADPIKTLKTSVMGTLNMLGLAKRTKARILHASTSEVYGDPLEHPQTESYWGNVNPTGIRACYDEGKRAAETLIMDYLRIHAVDAKIVRIFNTYGPRMRHDDGRVVSNFIVQALTGQDITVYGNGRQTRSFCYVNDLIEVIDKMMRKDDYTGPINIGNPSEFTILELAQKVLQLTDSSSKLIYEDLPQDDPKQRKPNIERAKWDFNWRPQTQLEDGLKPTIDYFKDWLQNNSIT